MKSAIIYVSVAILLSGCVEYAETGKHVQIEGPETQEQKLALAQHVLAALPVQRVREQVRQRFPQLTSRDLKRINLDYAVMEFQDGSNAPRREVHLIVTVWRDETLQPIADQIQDFVASLLQAELSRQRGTAPIKPMSRTGGIASAPLVMAKVVGALPPVGYLER